MTWTTQLKMTPRLVSMLQAEESRATERGDGYLGTEHLLEALINELDGVAGQILQRLGVVDEVRSELEQFWSSPVHGSLLMTNAPPDPAGDPYQVALISDRPGAPDRLDLDDEGHPQVLVMRQTETGLELTREPAPQEIADAAFQWQEEQDQPHA